MIRYFYLKQLSIKYYKDNIAVYKYFKINNKSSRFGNFHSNRSNLNSSKQPKQKQGDWWRHKHSSKVCGGGGGGGGCEYYFIWLFEHQRQAISLFKYWNGRKGRKKRRRKPGNRMSQIGGTVWPMNDERAPVCSPPADSQWCIDELAESLSIDGQILLTENNSNQIERKKEKKIKNQVFISSKRNQFTV